MSSDKDNVAVALPALGKIVLVVDAQLLVTVPAIVTQALDGGTINATGFLVNGGMRSYYAIPMTGSKGKHGEETLATWGWPPA